MCRGQILVLRVHFLISRFSQLVLSRLRSSRWGNLFPFDLLHCVSCLSEWSQIQSATATFLSHWIFSLVVILLRLCFKVRRLAWFVLLGKFLVVRPVGVLVPGSGLPLRVAGWAFAAAVASFIALIHARRTGVCVRSRFSVRSCLRSLLAELFGQVLFVLELLVL
jgi:hypothetical protein